MGDTDWVTHERLAEERRLAHPWAYCTTATFAHWSDPADDSVIECAYCGSQKIGVGPSRCLSCGASKWKVVYAR